MVRKIIFAGLTVGCRWLDLNGLAAYNALINWSLRRLQ